MKKIYSLLLLGAFMLLGAESAWGTEYKLHHDGKLEGSAIWIDSKVMIDAGSGYYAMMFPNVAASQSIEFSFKVDNTWNDAQAGWIDNENSDVTLSKSSNKLTFTTPSSVSSIVVYFNGSKCYVKTITTTYSVELSWNRTMYCYVYDQYKNLYTGAWHGYTGTSKTISNVPSGTTLYAIFNNGSDAQSHSILIGTITSNVEMSYNIGADYVFHAVTGTFNSWQYNYLFDEGSNAVIVPMEEGDYSIKIPHCYYSGSSDGATWYGADDTNISSTIIGKNLSQKEGSGNGEIGLTITTAGNYVFALKTDGYGNPSILNTYFPGSTYSRTFTSKWGTICLPFNVPTLPAGVTCYEIVNKVVDGEGNPTKIIMAEVSSLASGKPYITYVATPGAFDFTMGTTAAMLSENNGLFGSYINMDVASNMYIFNSNTLYKAGTGCSILANRAYINMDEIEDLTGSLAPERRIIEMPLAPNGTTDIKSIEVNEKAVKFFQKGQLFIQKNGVVYDVTGRAVK